jgi:DNA-binding SARP family transcriptional activator/tetratricopeptide (TPR) repeat protein
MQFRVLGTLEVIDATGRPVDVGGAQPRAVLAMLLVGADRVVPTDTIVERLWPDGPPPSAISTLQSYVSRLRRALEPAGGKGSRMLTFEASGYRLQTGDDAVDFVRFERGADAGRDLLERGDVAAARAQLAAALDLWSGPALQEFADHPWARGVATRLDERRLAAIEDRIRADLLTGQHQVLIGELSDLIAQHPLREGFWEHYAIALYRSGRQAEALRALDDLRRQLIDGLGVDPSPRIRELESKILGHDPSLAAPAPSPATPQRDATFETETMDASRISRHFSGMFDTALVGRVTERRMLSAALGNAVNRRTQWVLIEGEPGIGKTRLLEHLAEEATEAGFEVLWGRSYESGATPAFWPWLGALRGLNDPSHPLPGSTQETIDTLLSPTGDESSRPVDAGRYRLFEAIALLIEQAALRRPLMIALDDLQWADPASLELIEFLSGHVLGARVVFAATVRELEIGRNDAVVQATASVSRRPAAQRIHLVGVDRAESAAIVRQAIGDSATPEVIQAIHQRSEGNPFFIGELARLLEAEPDLTEAEIARRAGVPAGVRDVVHRRLRSLPDATSALVQMMATIGRETHLGLLARAAGVPMDRCIDELDPGLVNRLIIDVPGSPGSVRFSHALIREVVLDDMSRLRRSRMHLSVADAIEATSRLMDDDSAEILAEHLWQAVSLGVTERAARALERAAEVALRRFAYETADGLLERALQLRHDMPPDEADLDAELDVITRLIVVRRIRFGFERARSHTPIERAKELARKTNREHVLAELLWTEWGGAATACDFVASKRLAEELMDLAEISDDPLIRATAHHSWGVHCWHTGRISEAVEHVDIAVEIIDSSSGEQLVASGPFGGLLENQLLNRGFRVVFHALAGDPLPGGSPLPALAREQTDPYGQLIVWVCEALAHLISDDLETALSAATSAQAIEVGESFEFFRSGAICLLGSAQVDSGSFAEGLATITRGVSRYSAVDVLTVTPFYLSMAAYACVALDDVDAAVAWVDRAAALSERTGEMWEQPFVLAANAHVRHAQGAPPSEVAGLFEEAHAMAVAQGAHGTARRVAGRAADVGITIS